MDILDTLTSKEKSLLLINRYKEGTRICIQGDECHYVYYVLEGEIKIISNEGITYNYVKEKKMFGNNLLFSSNPKYKGNVIANKDTTLYLFNKKTLIYLLQNNIEFLLEYLKIQGDFGKELNDEIKLLSLNNVEDRLLFYINKNKGIIKYKNITSLSKTLLVSREALSRTITKLVNNKIIIKDKKTIKVIQ